MIQFYVTRRYRSADAVISDELGPEATLSRVADEGIHPAHLAAVVNREYAETQKKRDRLEILYCEDLTSSNAHC